MTYDQILTLDTIVNTGSFKAASQVMHKSQPALSMAIKKLEDEFGIKIFNRDAYRPVLTPEGEAFHKKSIKLIKEFKALEHTASEMGAGLESEISICTDAIFPIGIISKTIRNFFAPHINITLNLNTDVLDGVISKIRNHQVDFALGPDFNLGEDIEKIMITTVKMIPVIGREKYEKIKNEKELLKRLPQIFVSSSIKEKRATISGQVSDQIWYTSDFAMKKSMIEANLGWGRLPEHQAREAINSGRLIPITAIEGIDTISAPMYLLRSKTKVMGPNTKRLWDYLARPKTPR